MKLVDTALRAPYTVIVGVLATAVLGLTCLSRMPVDILPQFRTPAVQIVTFYPGMPAEVMEKDITTRLERWTGQSAGIARQESRSLVGVSIVKDFFHEDVDPAAAIAQVSSYAMSDLFYLPPGTIPPMVMPFDPTASLPLALITVSSPTFDETKLYDVAYFDLRNRLQGIPGVIAPAVYGGKLRRILAYVDQDRLQARGLAPMDVVAALKQFSTLIPTGSVKLGAVDYQVITNGMPVRVDEMNDFPIKIQNGAPVFIRDVGEVRDSHQIQTNVVRIGTAPDFAGRRQVYIPIYRQPGSNTIQIVDGIRAALGSILARLPEGIRLDVVMDQSVYVRQAIRSLVNEGLLGGLLAAVMILIFLGSLRSTFVITLAIPLSVLAAFIGLYFTGNSINAMVLGGLALAVGRLVDDAIVVLENTTRHLALGKPPFQAALDGAAEVAMPVLVATITTIVVFCPVVFLTGIGKFLFTPLALAVGFSIAASYLVAMTVVPTYCARFLTEAAAEDASAAPGMHTRFERWFSSLNAAYRRALEGALRRPWRTLAAAGALFAVALAASPLIGTELFPEADAGQLSIRMRAASGTRIERTEDLAAEVERQVRETIPASDLAMVITNIGVLNDWPAAYTPNAGPQDAFFEIQLTADRSMTARASARRVRERLAAALPEAEFSFHSGGLVSAALNFGLPSPIDVQVSGNNLGIAHDIAERVRRAIADVPGAVDVRIQQRQDYPAIAIDVDRVRAAHLGLTPKAVVQNVVTSLNSSINFDPAFWVDASNGNHYFLGVQYDERAIDSLATLESIPVSTGTNNILGIHPTAANGVAEPGAHPALLTNLATLKRTTAPTEVNHLNISRVIDVFANIDGRDVGSVADSIERRLEPLRVDLPAGYSIQMRGEVQSMAESFASLGFGFLLATVLIYLVMVAQFRSFLDPFVIMFAVPLGLIGVVGTLLLTGTTLNVQSFMGVIFMVGIAVSNSVLLVEFANRLRAAGRPLDDAAVEAGAVRLRPILMTSLAAVLGLLPMAIGLGHGSEANVPLARAVVGGLSVSTVLTLFVVPVLYRLLRARTTMSPTPLVAVLAAVALGAAAATGAHADGGGTTATAVQVVQPERRSLHRRRTLPASVEPFEVVRLYAKVAGYLADIRVDIGDRVRKDETLALIEVPETAAERPVLDAELAEAKAQLGKAEAANELQRAIYERSQALRARGSITEQDLEQARAQHATAAAEVALAKARIASVRARVKRLDTLLTYATITAPFDGVVTERFVHPGALIQVATASSTVSPIITVQRADVVRATTAAPEADVPFVDRGDPATLVLRALAERPFAAAVTRMADALDPATRTMRVEVDVPNPDGALRPGMYGELSLDLDQRPGVLTVPATAVLNDKGQPVVYIVDGGAARRVSVTTGAEDGGYIEIRGGLDGTERIVAGGGGALADGTPVRVIEPGASGRSAASR